MWKLEERKITTKSDVIINIPILNFEVTVDSCAVLRKVTDNSPIHSSPSCPSANILYNCGWIAQSGDWQCYDPLHPTYWDFTSFVYTHLYVCVSVCMYVCTCLSSSLQCYHMYRLMCPQPQSRHRTVPSEELLVLPPYSHSHLPPSTATSNLSSSSIILSFQECYVVI